MLKLILSPRAQARRQNKPQHPARSVENRGSEERPSGKEITTIEWNDGVNGKNELHMTFKSIDNIVDQYLKRF